MSSTNQIFTEIAPLSPEDSLYIVERDKEHFDYPVHSHSVFELNYLEGASGANRIVGDSIEEVSGSELVLITSENLEHGWVDGSTPTGRIREVTIQFSQDLLGDSMLDKKQFHSIKKLIVEAQRGVVFDLRTVLRVRPLINALTVERSGFYSVVTFLTLLYELSVDDNYRVLSSSYFAHNVETIKSRRINRVDRYLRENFSRVISVEEVADLINISPAAFSRFFKAHTGTNFSNYLSDIRVGYISRELIDSKKSITEICFESGFNNISNFNRVFKQKKGYSPREFREVYKKHRVVL